MKDIIRLYDNRWRFYINIFAINKNIHFHQARPGTDNPHTPLDLTLIFFWEIAQQRHHKDKAKTPQRHSKDTTKTQQRHHKDTTKTQQRHSKDTTKTPQRHSKDTAKTPQKHHKDTESQTQHDSILHDLNQDNIEQSVHWCDPTGETSGFMVKIQSHEVETPNYDQHILSITCEQNEMNYWTRCSTLCSSSAPTECILRHDQLASAVRIKLILLRMIQHTTLT